MNLERGIMLFALGGGNPHPTKNILTRLGGGQAVFCRPPYGICKFMCGGRIWGFPPTPKTLVLGHLVSGCNVLKLPVAHSVGHRR